VNEEADSVSKCQDGSHEKNKADAQDDDRLDNQAVCERVLLLHVVSRDRAQT
jgi:hypothetical protein